MNWSLSSAGCVLSLFSASCSLAAHVEYQKSLGFERRFLHRDLSHFGTKQVQSPEFGTRHLSEDNVRTSRLPTGWLPAHAHVCKAQSKKQSSSHAAERLTGQSPAKWLVAVTNHVLTNRCVLCPARAPKLRTDAVKPCCQSSKHRQRRGYCTWVAYDN